jgi:hypothetical protein
VLYPNLYRRVCVARVDLFEEASKRLSVFAVGAFGVIPPEEHDDQRAALVKTGLNSGTEFVRSFSEEDALYVALVSRRDPPGLNLIAREALFDQSLSGGCRSALHFGVNPAIRAGDCAGDSNEVLPNARAGRFGPQ